MSVVPRVFTAEHYAHALTHAHPDHQGASKQVCDTLGVPFWVGAALYVGFLAWVGYAVWLLVRPGRANIPRAVVSFIAGISLLDGLLMAGAGAPGAAWGVGGFGHGAPLAGFLQHGDVEAVRAGAERRHSGDLGRRREGGGGLIQAVIPGLTRDPPFLRML